MSDKRPDIETKIRSKVYEAMIEKLGEMIPQKMGEAGLQVECHVCGKEAEAEIFFDILDRME